MVAKPRVAAKTASDSADTGTNSGEGADGASWAVSASPWREKTSASSGAYHPGQQPEQAAGGGHRPEADGQAAAQVADPAEGPEARHHPRQPDVGAERGRAGQDQEQGHRLVEGAGALGAQAPGDHDQQHEVEQPGGDGADQVEGAPLARVVRSCRVSEPSAARQRRSPRH